MNIKDKIYEIRGSKIMIDRDLAGLIGYETRILNQIVKRNLDKFNVKDYFQLTSFEFNNWKSQIVTSKEDKIGLRKLPYIFTEQGVAMLASVLKTEIASKISVGIMRTFVMMRKYISKTLINSDAIINNHENRIKKLEETFNKLEVKKEHLFFEGQIYDAYSLLIEILSVAKEK